MTRVHSKKSVFDFLNLFGVVLILLLEFQCKAERLFQSNPYSHREILDPNGKFLLEWIATPKSSDIVFNITAETRGYVAIGLSKTGRMTKSDIVMAGVDRGISYISDRFTRHDRRVPVEDIQQNWKLHGAWENKTHTSVRISRKKNTCDPQDYAINDNTLFLIWAFGEDDTADYHFQNRGTVQLRLLQPDLAPQVPSQQSASNALSKSLAGLDVWRLTVNVNQVPSGDSWCVFQKGPELETKSNIIGFSTPVTDEMVMKHLDRVIIYKCKFNYAEEKRNLNMTEDMMQSQFEDLVDYSGECKNATELFSFCKDIIYTWGMGGQDTFLPKNVGIPFGGEEDYYLLESYLVVPKDNQNNSETKPTDEPMPAKNDEFVVNIHTDILLTESPRKFEAKILQIGYDPSTNLLIPPNSKEFEAFGHCANECTSKMIPKRKPLRVFGVSFDTGEFGKAVSLHHLRNAFELPLLFQDENHRPSSQQMQILSLETPIRQGDQITVRCKYRSALGSGIAPPPSSNNSMPEAHRCLAYLWYYQDKMNTTSGVKDKDTPHIYECTSKIHPGDFARWVDENAPSEIRRYIGSPQLVDKLRKQKWTPRLLFSLYELYELGRYRSSCGGVIGNQQQRTVNGTNKIETKASRGNGYNNGTSRRSGPNPASSSSSPTGEITVYPLPVEEESSTMGCPTLDRPLIIGPPGPVIFGFP